MQILPVLIAGAVPAFAVNLLAAKGKKWPMKLFIGLILLMLVILKTPRLSLWLSKSIRILNGQSADLALSSDIRWF